MDYGRTLLKETFIEEILFDREKKVSYKKDSLLSILLLEFNFDVSRSSKFSNNNLFINYATEESEETLDGRKEESKKKSGQRFERGEDSKYKHYLCNCIALQGCQRKRIGELSIDCSRTRLGHT